MEKILVKSYGKCPKLPWMIDFHSNKNGKVLNCQMEALNAQNYLEYMSLLNTKSNSAPERLTKLISNIKNWDTHEEIKGLLENTNVIKLNMKDFESETDCEEKIKLVRQTAENYSQKIKRIYPLAIALEIEAPTTITEPNQDQSAEIAKDIMKCLIMRTVPSYQLSTNFVVRQKVDIIFLSKILNGTQSIKEMKKILNEEKTISTLIFSIIQTQENLDQIDEILKESDGIVIDLNHLLNLLNEKYFLSQKSIIAKCNIFGKPVIGITDSRNELKKSDISDISTMVIDGIDGLILENPSIDLIDSVSRLCREAESAIYQKLFTKNHLATTHSYLNEMIYTLGLSAVETSIKLRAAAIIVLTISGRSAKILSRFRPKCPIIAVTRYLRIAKQLQIFRNILPVFYVKNSASSTWIEDVGQRVQIGITFGKYQGFIKMGDVLVILTGSRPGSGFTNNMRIVYASEHDTRKDNGDDCNSFDSDRSSFYNNNRKKSKKLSK